MLIEHVNGMHLVRFIICTSDSIAFTNSLFWCHRRASIIICFHKPFTSFGHCLGDDLAVQHCLSFRCKLPMWEQSERTVKRPYPNGHELIAMQHKIPSCCDAAFYRIWIEQAVAWRSSTSSYNAGCFGQSPVVDLLIHGTQASLASQHILPAARP